MASKAVPAPVPVKKADKAAAGRVEKPDEAAFKAKLAVLEKELAEAKANSVSRSDNSLFLRHQSRPTWASAGSPLGIPTSMALPLM